MKAKSIPNILTLLRLVLCPLFIVLAAQQPEWMRWTAWVMVIIALVTDVIDGGLARKHGWVTKTGVYLDPAVDKIVLLSGFFQMMYWGWLPLWLPLILMARELIVNSMRSGAAIEGRLVAANWMGKTKAFAMCVTLGVGYFVNAFTGPGAAATGTTWVTVVQGFSYVTVTASVIFGITFLWKHREVFIESKSIDTPAGGQEKG